MEYIYLNYIGEFKKDKLVFLGHLIVDAGRVLVDTSPERVKSILSSLVGIDSTRVSAYSGEMQPSYVVQTRK